MLANVPIFCIGGANLDRKLTSLGVLTPGTSNPVNSNTSWGGVARNVAENLSHWTHNIHLQCVIGADKEGQQLIQHMQQKGVHVDHCLTLPHHKTSQYYAVLDPQGELQIAFADMDIYNHIPIEDFIAPWKNWPEHSIVMIDTNLPPVLLEQVIQRCDKNIKLCIDPVSVSKAKKIPMDLENVFLIKPNQSEAGVLTNLHLFSISDCVKAGHRLLNRGAKNVVISLGKEGYVIVNETLQLHVQTQPIHTIIDVNGAGDAFIAGILFGLQQNSTIIYACHLGAAAAAFTLQSYHTVVQDMTSAHLTAWIEASLSRKESYAAVF